MAEDSSTKERPTFGQIVRKMNPEENLKPGEQPPVNRREFLRVLGLSGLGIAASCLGINTMIRGWPLSSSRKDSSPQAEDSNYPIPRETESMKTLVDELKVILPETSPELRYLRGGGDIKFWKKYQIDGWFVAFKAGNQQGKEALLEIFEKSLNSKENKNAWNFPAINITQIEKYAKGNPELTSLLSKTKQNDIVDTVRVAIETPSSVQDAPPRLDLIFIKGQVKNDNLLLGTKPFADFPKGKEGPGRGLTEEFLAIDTSIRRQI